MQMENSSKSKVIFPFAPRPFPRESIASWVIRLCGSHDYTFARLKLLVNVKVRRNDWDCGMDHLSTLRLLESAGFEYTTFFDEKFNPNVVQQRGMTLRPRSVQGVPYYAFCPMCFAEDEVPYLRWHWRFENFHSCKLHQRNFLTKCPHCDARLDTSRPILRDISSEEFIPNLSYCKNCAQPLFVIFEKQPEPYRNPWESPGEWIRPVDPNDAESVYRWLCIGRLGSSSWKMRFNMPAEIKPVWKPRKIGQEQYRYLSIYGRAKVAKALRIIRAEKHRQRTEERLGEQENKAV